jgi:hypothetical protein
VGFEVEVKLDRSKAASGSQIIVMMKREPVKVTCFVIKVMNHNITMLYVVFKNSIKRSDNGEVISARIFRLQNYKMDFD